MIEEGKQPQVRHPFKGNMDIGRLVETIERVGLENIPLVMVTVTESTDVAWRTIFNDIKIDIRF